MWRLLVIWWLLRLLIVWGLLMVRGFPIVRGLLVVWGLGPFIRGLIIWWGLPVWGRLSIRRLLGVVRGTGRLSVWWPWGVFTTRRARWRVFPARRTTGGRIIGIIKGLLLRRQAAKRGLAEERAAQLVRCQRMVATCKEGRNILPRSVSSTEPPCHPRCTDE